MDVKRFLVVSGSRDRTIRYFGFSQEMLSDLRHSLFIAFPYDNSFFILILLPCSAGNKTAAASKTLSFNQNVNSLIFDGIISVLGAPAPLFDPVILAESNLCAGFSNGEIKLMDLERGETVTTTQGHAKCFVFVLSDAFVSLF